MKSENNIFEQKHGFNYRKYTLFTDKLIVETQDISKNNKFELKLDKIGYDIYYQADSTKLGKIFFYVCLIIPIILWIVYFIKPEQVDLAAAILNNVIWWGLALWNILKKHKDEVFLVGGQVNLAFFRTIPSEEEVLHFIKTIIATSKAYLKTKYAVVDINIPEEEFNGRIYWLKENEIISENEFFKLKEEYSIKKLLL